jgi:hypothetical protein
MALEVAQLLYKAGITATVLGGVLGAASISVRANEEAANEKKEKIERARGSVT